MAEVVLGGMTSPNPGFDNESKDVVLEGHGTPVFGDEVDNLGPVLPNFDNRGRNVDLIANTGGTLPSGEVRRSGVVLNPNPDQVFLPAPSGTLNPGDVEFSGPFINVVDGRIVP